METASPVQQVITDLPIFAGSSSILSLTTNMAKMWKGQKWNKKKAESSLTLHATFLNLSKCYAAQIQTMKPRRTRYLDLYSTMHTETAAQMHTKTFLCSTHLDEAREQLHGA